MEYTLDDIMKIDDVICSNISGILSDKDRDTLIRNLDGEELATKCLSNWEYARKVLYANNIMHNVDGVIQFRLLEKIYCLHISCLGYAMQRGSCYTLTYNERTDYISRENFESYINNLVA